MSTFTYLVNESQSQQFGSENLKKSSPEEIIKSERKLFQSDNEKAPDIETI